MALKAWLKMHAIRRALSVGVAVAISLVVSRYVGDVSPGWLVLTALLVSQTTRGTPLRQSIFYSFFILLLVTIAGVFHPQFWEWIFDVMIGGVIGILCSQFILPVRLFGEFSQGLLPELHAIKSFNTEFINLLSGGNAYEALHLSKESVEKALLARYSAYPEWVYEVGFNRGLRAGYRFFLVNIERISEIVFSLDFRAEFIKELEIRPFAKELQQVIINNNQLLEQLEQYFNSQSFAVSQDDYTSDMALLEEKVKANIPAKLDFLEVYPDTISLVAVLRDIKDMRQLLLLLVLSATAKESKR